MQDSNIIYTCCTKQRKFFFRSRKQRGNVVCLYYLTWMLVKGDNHSFQPTKMRLIAYLRNQITMSNMHTIEKAYRCCKHGCKITKKQLYSKKSSPSFLILHSFLYLCKRNA